MENPEIVINLTPDEALVLPDWLEQVQMTELSRLVDDAAVWASLHSALLEPSTSRCRGSLRRTMPNVWKRPAAGFVQHWTTAPPTRRVRMREAPFGED
ncbi:hypothetical protein AB0E74_09055 [Streptomyces sp. NPDC030392]|uniref:hypothetical protein n=1 Tax=Streptomyces sp. NPDC030392 TaxID=3155468 RepID=UPI0033DD8930